MRKSNAYPICPAAPVTATRRGCFILVLGQWSIVNDQRRGDYGEFEGRFNPLCCFVVRAKRRVPHRFSGGGAIVTCKRSRKRKPTFEVARLRCCHSVSGTSRRDNRSPTSEEVGHPMGTQFPPVSIRATAHTIPADGPTNGDRNDQT